MSTVMLSPFKSFSIDFLTSGEALCINFPASSFELVSTQYVFNFLSSIKFVIDQGLYISLLLPNENPSYHCFTSSFLSEIPTSSNALKTSSSVNPKHVSYILLVVDTILKLFKSENMLSLDILVIPVIIALSRYGLVLNVALKKTRIKPTISSQYPPKYAS